MIVEIPLILCIVLSTTLSVARIDLALPLTVKATEPNWAKSPSFMNFLKTIFESNTSGWTDVHFGCRLEINNRKLHATLGDRGNRYNAQDAEKHGGSVIRLNLDGSIPKDNPKLEGWAPEIYSIGHRNPQGIIINPITGEIWTHEHGPQGGDEINIIIPGDNYGWPLVSHGYEYGTENRVSKYNSLDGFNDPEWVWLPSIAPSGMAFYPSKDMTKKMFPELNKTLLVGSLKFRRLYVLEPVSYTHLRAHET